MTLKASSIRWWHRSIVAAHRILRGHVSHDWPPGLRLGHRTISLDFDGFAGRHNCYYAKWFADEHLLHLLLVHPGNFISVNRLNLVALLETFLVGGGIRRNVSHNKFGRSARIADCLYRKPNVSFALCGLRGRWSFTLCSGWSKATRGASKYGVSATSRLNALQICERRRYQAEFSFVMDIFPAKRMTVQ